jgi:hypothetical protein
MNFACHDSVRTPLGHHYAEPWLAGLCPRKSAEFGAWITLAIITAVVHAYMLEGYDFGPMRKEALVVSASQQIGKLQQDLRTKAEVFIDSAHVPGPLRFTLDADANRLKEAKPH